MLFGTNDDSTFTGWIDLSAPMKCIITYGRMKGIRFSFAHVADKHFGDVEDSNDIYTQPIDGTHGEKIIGVYAIMEEESYGENDSNTSLHDDGSVSATSKNEPTRMPRLWVNENVAYLHRILLIPNSS